MKILYLHQYFNTPRMSGGTRSYEMARRLVASGHEVHMVTSDRADAKTGTRSELVDGIWVHWISVPYDNRMSYLRRIYAFFVFAVRASRISRSLRADVVFATSTPLTICLPAIVAKVGRRTPMVFEVRDLWPSVPIALGALRSNLARKLALALESLAYRNSHRIIALSEGMADGVAKRGYPRDQISVIPNSCDNDLFNLPETAGLEFMAERPWLGRGPLVVYTGTFGRVNGLAFMVEMAAASAARRSDVCYLAIGTGVEEDEVRAKGERLGVLGRNFFMEPPLPKCEIPSALSAASVCTSFVIPVPELEANSANKFFDALAAGRPIAINHRGWQAEMIQKEGIGLVLDPSSPQRAAEQVDDFLRDHERVELARSNSRRLSGSFSRDALARQLIDVLEDSYNSTHTLERTQR